MLLINNIKLCVIGLGYVGLPLAIEFAKYREVIGFDINKKRIDELIKGEDTTLEVSEDELVKAKRNFHLTNDVQTVKNCNVYIITVPTPIDVKKKPDLLN